MENIGFLAAFLTTIAFIPQAVKVLREKDTRAISLPMYLLFTAGVTCWLLYGIAIDSLPIIIANIITVTLSLIILICKIRNKD